MKVLVRVLIYIFIYLFSLLGTMKLVSSVMMPYISESNDVQVLLGVLIAFIVLVWWSVLIGLTLINEGSKINKWLEWRK